MEETKQLLLNEYSVFTNIYGVNAILYSTLDLDVVIYEEPSEFLIDCIDEMGVDIKQIWEQVENERIENEAQIIIASERKWNKYCLNHEKNVLMLRYDGNLLISTGKSLRSH